MEIDFITNTGKTAKVKKTPTGLWINGHKVQLALGRMWVNTTRSNNSKQLDLGNARERAVAEAKVGLTVSEMIQIHVTFPIQVCDICKTNPALEDGRCISCYKADGSENQG